MITRTSGSDVAEATTVNNFPGTRTESWALKTKSLFQVSQHCSIFTFITLQSLSLYRRVWISFFRKPAALKHISNDGFRYISSLS